MPSNRKPKVVRRKLVVKKRSGPSDELLKKARERLRNNPPYTPFVASVASNDDREWFI